MMDHSSKQFLELTDEEILSRLNHVLGSETGIVINTSELRVETKLSRFIDKTKGGSWTLVITDFDVTAYGQAVMNFKWGKTQFFAKGEIQKDSSNDGFHFQFDKMFRLEHRVAERLLVFPHRKSYVYLNITTVETENNVVPLFSKKIGIDVNFLDKFTKILRQEEKEKGLNETHVGFRVIDVSSSGIAFVANKHEAELISSQGSFASLKFEIDNFFYDIERATLKYVVDYFDGRMIDVPMKKIGLQFDKGNGPLTRKIERILREFDDGREVVMEFYDNF